MSDDDEEPSTPSLKKSKTALRPNGLETIAEEGPSQAEKDESAEGVKEVTKGVREVEIDETKKIVEAEEASPAEEAAAAEAEKVRKAEEAARLAEAEETARLLEAERASKAAPETTPPAQAPAPAAEGVPDLGMLAVVVSGLQRL